MKISAKFGLVFLLILPLVCGVTIALSACAAEADGPTGNELIDKGNPKLDTQLNRLVKAEAQGEIASFAQENGIELTGNSVRVIIEYSEGQLDPVSGAVKENGGIVETSYKDLLQAIVPVSALETLTDEPGIRLIRLPMEPLPGTGGE